MNPEGIATAKGHFLKKFPGFTTFPDSTPEFREQEDDYKRAAVVSIRNVLDSYVQGQARFGTDEETMGVVLPST